MATVHAKTDACVGSGLCSFISEKYFEVGKSAVVEVLQETLDDEDRPVVQEAITSCPTQALWLEES